MTTTFQQSISTKYFILTNDSLGIPVCRQACPTEKSKDFRTRDFADSTQLPIQTYLAS